MDSAIGLAGAAILKIDQSSIQMVIKITIQITDHFIIVLLLATWIPDQSI